MAGQPLLIEIRTEELPPRALPRLMEAFSHGINQALDDLGFLAADAEGRPFATPRRLAVLVSDVLDRQPDRKVERKGPSVAAALGADGQPTAALAGFARSCGVPIAQLERRAGDKGEYFVHVATHHGEPLRQHLPELVENVLRKLPVPKLMRWGSGEAQFVRPVHGVVLLHGRRTVPGTVLGVASTNRTLGHRFLGEGVLTVRQASDYEKQLTRAGRVIPHFETRREMMARALDTAAHRLGAGTRWDVGRAAELVDEVACLVEFPVVLVGRFDAAFLEVPRECLVMSMQQHQKYFPVVSADNRLLNQFLFVANMKAANPRPIIRGNERVLRARLSDARFFYDQDRKERLEARVPRLAEVVYHNRLGSQLDRIERLTRLSGEIARRLGADAAAAERSARLAKADLLTGMVGEFPELQGVMGRYYAAHDGEAPEVAVAIEQHYFPRGAGGELPQGGVAASVALADRLDTLTGIYGIGLAPTGDKDPFGLRRAALGIIRILVEQGLPLDVRVLLGLAQGMFPPGTVSESVAQDLYGFLLDRLRPYLRDRGYQVDEIEAVLALDPGRLDQAIAQLGALQAFRTLPEADALAAANKRIRNILRQAEGVPDTDPDPALLSEAAEQRLAAEIAALRIEVEPLFATGDYERALRRLASLRPAVDAFFDQVLVMAEDDAVRANRLALLHALGGLFLRAADLSRLQG